MPDTAQRDAAPSTKGAALELYRYIWRTSRGRQMVLAGLATVTLLLDLVPLELQRRIVNGALHDRDLHVLIILALLYVAAAVAQGGTKFALNLYQASVAEHANRKLRLAAGRTMLRARQEAARDPAHRGVGISIIVSEVEAVGGFVGNATSDLVLHGGVLISVFGYLLVLQPWMGLVGLLLFGPQLLFVPLLQNAINRRTAARIQVLRSLSVDIVKEATDAEPERTAGAFGDEVKRVYALNMQIFRRKFGMNFLMNLLQHVAVAGILLVGGLFVIQGRTEIGTIVAFISGLSRINDPWGDLVNYFRDLTNAGVKFRLIAGALEGSK